MLRPPQILALMLIMLCSGMSDAQASQTIATMTYRLSTQILPVRECPRLDCPLVTEYASGAILFVEGLETGDEFQNSTDWLRLQDQLTLKTVYAHSFFTKSFEPQAWMTAPVIPQVSETAREIYRQGLALGNRPENFSIVGDCQNVSAFFLAAFDTPAEYSLGTHAHLQATIDHFSGSWSREGESVDNGFNVASVLSPLWSDPKACQAGETPLACEYRLHQPSIVIISMETWWSERPAEEYEGYLVQIVEFWIERGVVPILGTKADNLEGDYSINQAVYRVAQAYEVPLWNFWLAIQTLPGNGLSEDKFHLTFARNFFDDPQRLKHGWVVRNLTALQAIDAVYRGVQPSSDS